MGRPSDYSQETADEICDWIESGQSLRAFCRQEGKPSFTSVKRWLREHETFRAQYAQARDDQADALADDLLTIADDAEIPADQKRIMVDTRKWIASKLKPRKYGDKIDHDHTGEIVVRFEDASGRS